MHCTIRTASMSYRPLRELRRYIKQLNLKLYEFNQNFTKKIPKMFHLLSESRIGAHLHSLVGTRRPVCGQPPWLHNRQPTFEAQIRYLQLGFVAYFWHFGTSRSFNCHFLTRYYQRWEIELVKYNSRNQVILYT